MEFCCHLEFLIIQSELFLFIPLFIKTLEIDFFALTASITEFLPKTDL